MIFKKCKILFLYNEKGFYICIRIQGIPDETSGEMAERSNAAVLKTVDCNRSGGSNPSFSAKRNPQHCCGFFIFQKNANSFGLF